MTLDEIIPYLPHFQAILNASAALFLATGYYFIRNQNRDIHRNCMIIALVISTVFMVSYLTYHARVGYMPFTGQGMIRPFYFTLLASHVILAALIVPLVLTTVVFALITQTSRHQPQAFQAAVLRACVTRFWTRSLSCAPTPVQ